MNARKRFSISNLLLVTLFTVIAVFMTMAMDNLSLRYQIDTLSQGFYTDNAVYFKLTPHSGTDLISTVANLDAQDFLLSRDYLSLTRDIRGVIHKGKIQTPPLAEGRFFNESDYHGNHRVAVVGRNLTPELQNENGVRYFVFAGKKYEVIGILGYKIPTEIDRTCMLNLDAVLKDSDTTDGRYVVDGQGNVFGIYEKIAAAGLTSKSYETSIIKTEQSGLKRFYRKSLPVTFLYILIIISIIVSSMAISYYWVEKKRKTVAVMRLIGFDDLKVTRYVIISYLKLVLAGYLTGLSVLWILHATKVWDFYALDPGKVLFALVWTVLAGVFITAVPVIKSLNVSVRSIVR